MEHCLVTSSDILNLYEGLEFVFFFCVCVKFVLDIHLCIQKRNNGFSKFVLKVIESCVVFNSSKFQITFPWEWVTVCSKSGQN